MRVRAIRALNGFGMKKHTKAATVIDLMVNDPEVLVRVAAIHFLDVEKQLNLTYRKVLDCLRHHDRYVRRFATSCLFSYAHTQGTFS